MMEELARRTHLPQAAIQQECHPVGKHQGLGLVMGDKEHGHPGFRLNGLDKLAHALTQGGIQVAERFIQKQDGRFQHQGPRDRHPLLLAARQLRRPAVAEPGQPDLGEQLVGTSAALLGRAGHRVTLLERHPQAVGGHARNLEIEGLEFCVGPQYLWGFGEGDIATRVLERLDLAD